MGRGMVLSYLTLRKAVGITGMLLAFLCVIGGLVFGSGKVEQSISAYYMTNMREMLTMTLAIAGAFLFAYNGYNNADMIITSIAGGFAIGIAIFPMAYVSPGNLFNIPMPTLQVLHFISAASFFILLAYMSFFQFTKSGILVTAAKINRNRVYKVCGVIIMAGVLFLAVDAIKSMGTYTVLIVEAIMLIAFGTSWLVKGEAVLKDE